MEPNPKEEIIPIRIKVARFSFSIDSAIFRLLKILASPMPKSVVIPVKCVVRTTELETVVIVPF